jgi:hypothetical protein
MPTQERSPSEGVHPWPTMISHHGDRRGGGGGGWRQRWEPSEVDLTNDIPRLTMMDPPIICAGHPIKKQIIFHCSLSPFCSVQTCAAWANYASILGKSSANMLHELFNSLEMLQGKLSNSFCDLGSVHLSNNNMLQFSNQYNCTDNIIPNLAKAQRIYWCKWSIILKQLA